MDERPQLDGSHSKTFLAVCDKCGLQRVLTLDDLDLSHQKPFQIDCSCGNACKVSINNRTTARKSVNLIMSFTLASDTGRVDHLGNVLDISTTGMLIGTDPIQSLTAGQSLTATILLGNKQKTKVEVPCVIRRIREDKGRLTLGVQFKELTSGQRRLLSAVTTS